jgi:hypothetical protein
VYTYIHTYLLHVHQAEIKEQVKAAKRNENPVTIAEQSDVVQHAQNPARTHATRPEPSATQIAEEEERARAAMTHSNDDHKQIMKESATELAKQENERERVLDERERAERERERKADEKMRQYKAQVCMWLVYVLCVQYVHA